MIYSEFIDAVDEAGKPVTDKRRVVVIVGNELYEVKTVEDARCDGIEWVEIAVADQPISMEDLRRAWLEVEERR